MYGDIGTIEVAGDEENDVDSLSVEVSEFDIDRCSLDYDTIFRCFQYATTIAMRHDADKEEFKDLFFDKLLAEGCAEDEAEEIVEGFNPA